MRERVGWRKRERESKRERMQNSRTEKFVELFCPMKNEADLS